VSETITADLTLFSNMKVAHAQPSEDGHLEAVASGH
jgi:hypothetical protein